jgi:hypothetical protein
MKPVTNSAQRRGIVKTTKLANIKCNEDRKELNYIGIRAFVVTNKYFDKENVNYQSVFAKQQLPDVELFRIKCASSIQLAEPGKEWLCFIK